MDFTKVKMLLFAVFLCLDAFLFIQWHILEANVSVYAEPLSDQYASAQSALANSNVHVQAVLPTSYPEQASLLVVRGVNIHKTVKFPITPVLLLSAKNTAMNALHTFVVRKIAGGSAYSFLGWTRNQMNRSGVFTQQTGGLPIFSAPLIVSLHGQAVTGYSQTLLRIGESTKWQKAVISPINALFSLAQYLQKTKMTVANAITDIRFGYYSATEFPSGWYLAPVWRVHSIRAIFYINALNGEVEVAKNVG